MRIASFESVVIALSVIAQVWAANAIPFGVGGSDEKVSACARDFVRIAVSAQP